MSASLSSSGAVATPLSDDPHLSSAALCIKMRFGGSERSKMASSKSSSPPSSSSSAYLTGPEFTHQCFPEEWIPGYQPYHDDPRVGDVERRVAAQLLQLPSSSKKRQRLVLLPEHELLHRSLLLHKSHRHHSCHGGTAVQELAIDIQLAPSCQTCHVQLEIRNEPQPGSTKRLKPDGSTTATTITSATIETSSIGPSTPSAVDQGDNPSSSCMPREEILHCLDHALPRRVPSLEDVQNNFLTEPLGQVVRDYDIRLKRRKNRTAEDDDNHHPQNGNRLHKGNVGHDDDATLEFCLCLADGAGDPAVEEYHSQIQKLALFWIETAENVDISNDQSGFWKVLYLFRKHPRPTSSSAVATTRTTTITESISPSSPKNQVYSLAGFVTMFHFHAPFHKPEPGVIVRICQALILPPYQRQGHGQQMMQCVYDLAYNNKDTKDEVGGAGGANTIVLINVEDPAPAFVALRNKVDFCHVQNHMEWLKPPPTDNTKDHVGVVVSVTDEHFFTALPESHAISISAKAKIIPRQVHLVQEMLKLKALLEYTTSVPAAGGNEDDERNTMRDLLEKRFRLMVKKRLNKECREELSGLATLPEKQALLAKEFDRQLKQYESILGSATVH
jgi:histone acetyltransferase 1